jgi:hypothetical protein
MPARYYDAHVVRMADHDPCGPENYVGEIMRNSYCDAVATLDEDTMRSLMAEVAA